MLLLISERAAELNSHENVIVRTPAELCYIHPQSPALVIIDIKLPNAAVLDWAKKRNRATLWWLAGDNMLVDISFDVIPTQHCYIHQAHMNAAEFVQLLVPYYFGRSLDGNPDFVSYITLGELENLLIGYRELALFPECEVKPTQMFWSYSYWFMGSAFDMTIKEYERIGNKLRNDLGVEQMSCQISNLAFSSFVLVLR